MSWFVLHCDISWRDKVQLVGKGPIAGVVRETVSHVGTGDTQTFGDNLLVSGRQEKESCLSDSTRLATSGENNYGKRTLLNVTY